MTKPIAEARVEGDFGSGAHLEAYGRSYKMEKSGGHYYISVALNGAPATKYEIDYTLGAKRFQGYLSKLPDGRIYVLPVFWHRTTGRWLDWSEIAPVPRHYTGDLRQIWNVNCVNCHGVNIVPNFDVATRTYKTTWTEMGIGCEDCHGPGAAHIAQMKAWAADPASKPAFDHSAKNHDVSRILKIFSPRTAQPRQVLDTCGYCHGNKTNYFLGFKPGSLMEDFAEPFLISQPIPPNDPQGEFWPDGRPSRFNRPQAVMDSQCFLKGGATCINCHVAHGSPYDHSLKLDIDVPGHPGEHSRQSDTLGTQCHKTISRPSLTGGAPRVVSLTTPSGLEAHTHHPADSQGSRCINCHMADLNWRLLTRRLDHTFKPPVPELTAAFGEPNACTSCHDDKTPEWASAALDRWYGNHEARQRILSVATTMYRAGAGETAALGDIAFLAGDRSKGPILRASAAEFAGRLIWALRGGSATAAAPGARVGPTQTSFGGARAEKPGGPPISPGSDVQSPESFPGRPMSDVPEGRRTPDPGRPTTDSGLRTTDSGRPALSPGLLHRATNALLGAASDPEPVVRVAAIQALGFTGDPRAAAVLASHLTDPARVARANAAQALLRLGISHLADDGYGEDLRRAQAEYAESLSIFRDVASDHASLGWLKAETADTAGALKELQTALTLDPREGMAYVYLGVIAARAGHYSEAIENWERAKALGAGSGGIDRLIDEARKRAGH
jgi:hypothetical protein